MSLHLENVGRNFGAQWAVRDLSATIESGSTVAILGPNGAGKSTLLRLMAGWLPVSEGRVTINGFLLRPATVSVRRRLMLLDEPTGNQADVIETIGQAVNDYESDRAGIEAEVAEWFERLDLVGTYGKTTKEISKGQRFKVAMICLFLVRPLVWLLDEPFSAGLDAGGLQTLESEMQSHVRDGGMVVFSSQWPEHANRLADHSIVLHEGALVCHHRQDERVSPLLLQSAAPSLTAVLSGLSGD